MNKWGWPSILAALFCLYQNCTPFEAVESASLYHYSVQPLFFYDLKLVGIESDELMRHNFIFDVVISLVDNPNSPVSYRIDFSTLDIDPVCPSVVVADAEGDQRHFRVQCQVPVPDTLHVQLTMTAASGAQQIEQFSFRYNSVQ